MSRCANTIKRIIGKKGQEWIEMHGDVDNSKSTNVRRQTCALYIFSGTICYMLLHYDRDDQSWSYELFYNPPSHIRPTVKFRYVTGSVTDINGIDVHLHANQC